MQTPRRTPQSLECAYAATATAALGHGGLKFIYANELATGGSFAVPLGTGLLSATACATSSVVRKLVLLTSPTIGSPRFQNISIFDRADAPGEHPVDVVVRAGLEADGAPARSRPRVEAARRRRDGHGHAEREPSAC